MDNLLKNYEKACNELARSFAEEMDCYFDEEFWVGGMIGGVIMLGDYYVDINVIVDYYRYNYTPDEFIEWYNYSLEEKKEDKIPFNMNNFRELK